MDAHRPDPFDALDGSLASDHAANARRRIASGKRRRKSRADSWDHAAQNPHEGWYTVETILAHRYNYGLTQGLRRKEFCVKWLGFPHSENTWEPETSFFDKSVLQDYKAKTKISRTSFNSHFEGSAFVQEEQLSGTAKHFLKSANAEIEKTIASLQRRRFLADSEDSKNRDEDEDNNSSPSSSATAAAEDNSHDTSVGQNSPVFVLAQIPSQHQCVTMSSLGDLPQELIARIPREILERVTWDEYIVRIVSVSAKRDVGMGPIFTGPRAAPTHAKVQWCEGVLLAGYNAVMTIPYALVREKCKDSPPVLFLSPKSENRIFGQMVAAPQIDTSDKDSERDRAGSVAESANPEDDAEQSADTTDAAVDKQEREEKATPAKKKSSKTTAKSSVRGKTADEVVFAANRPSPVKTYKKRRTSTPIAGAARAREGESVEVDDGADGEENAAEDDADADAEQVQEEDSDNEDAADGEKTNSANDESGDEVFIVERILEHVYDKKSRSRLYKVRWKGYGSDEDTWEPAASFTDKSFIHDYDKKQQMLRKSSTSDNSAKVEAQKTSTRKRKISSVSSSFESTPSKAPKSSKNKSDRKSDEMNGSFDTEQIPAILHDLDSWDDYVVKIVHVGQGLGRSRVPTDKLKLMVQIKLSSDVAEEVEEPSIPLGTAMEKMRRKDKNAIAPAAVIRPVGLDPADEHTRSVARVPLHATATARSVPPKVQKTPRSSLHAKTAPSMANAVVRRESANMPTHTACSKPVDSAQQSRRAGQKRLASSSADAASAKQVNMARFGQGRYTVEKVLHRVADAVTGGFGYPVKRPGYPCSQTTSENISSFYDGEILRKYDSGIFGKERRSLPNILKLTSASIFDKEDFNFKTQSDNRCARKIHRFGSLPPKSTALVKEKIQEEKSRNRTVIDCATINTSVDYPVPVVDSVPIRSKPETTVLKSRQIKTRAKPPRSPCVRILHGAECEPTHIQFESSIATLPAPNAAPGSAVCRKRKRAQSTGAQIRIKINGAVATPFGKTASSPIGKEDTRSLEKPLISSSQDSRVLDSTDDGIIEFEFIFDDDEIQELNSKECHFKEQNSKNSSDADLIPRFIFELDNWEDYIAQIRQIEGKFDDNLEDRDCTQMLVHAVWKKSVLTGLNRRMIIPLHQARRKFPQKVEYLLFLKNF
ncbi:hypothetical protein HDU84_006336 [Entophlyctis sp. JEL0112]|nr:hypothetical protein HDU84_006336 [Entophlyctis sp. JEL0112]